MKDVLFLTLAEVVDIHSSQMRLYGGLPGIRDINLLSSAIAMPRAAFHGEYLHNDIYEMAAAYALHIGKNHPFIDGNKRTTLVSALVFLELNGVSITDPQGKLYDAMLDLSTGKLNKSEFASILRKLKD
ncbi:MAG: type II toxin-antitoxin system death-on-curing family toxin [Candidatus Brocadia sp.]|nr:MAG: type II toxin-antitoxin system death-on-curing family toxin [Candidatus Brocadia sp.]